MSRSADRLRRAEQAAQEARTRLGNTLDEIQQQLSPSKLMNDAVQEVKSRGQELVSQAAGKLLSRPVVATALASAIGLLFKQKPGLAAILKLILPNRATSWQPKHSRSRSRRSKAAESAPVPASEKETTG